MKMTTGFGWFLASSEVMLLLLLATTTTTLVHVAGLDTSATGTPTDDAIGACMTEVIDCDNDATCYSCMRMGSTSSTEALTCFQEAGIDEVESSTAACEYIIAGVCCFDLVSVFECLKNDPFVGYWTCFMKAKGCSEEEVTCEDDADIDSAADDDVDVGGGVDDDASIRSSVDDDVGSGAGDDVDPGSDVGDDGDDDANGGGEAEGTEGASNGSSAFTPTICYAWTLVLAFCCTSVLSIPHQRA